MLNFIFCPHNFDPCLFFSRKLEALFTPITNQSKDLKSVAKNIRSCLFGHWSRFLFCTIGIRLLMHSPAQSLLLVQVCYCTITWTPELYSYAISMKSDKGYSNTNWATIRGDLWSKIYCTCINKVQATRFYIMKKKRLTIMTTKGFIWTGVVVKYLPNLT